MPPASCLWIACYSRNPAPFQLPLLRFPVPFYLSSIAFPSYSHALGSVERWCHYQALCRDALAPLTTPLSSLRLNFVALSLIHALLQLRTEIYLDWNSQLGRGWTPLMVLSTPLPACVLPAWSTHQCLCSSKKVQFNIAQCLAIPLPAPLHSYATALRLYMYFV